MSLLRIDPQARREVEDALGRPVPEPGGPEFEAFLDELLAERPELHARLRDGLTVGVETPVEAQARLAAGRDRRRDLVRRLFYRDVYAGEPVLDKRRVEGVEIPVCGAVQTDVTGGQP